MGESSSPGVRLPPRALLFVTNLDMIRSWTDEQLQEAVRTSYSYCEVIRKLGLRCWRQLQVGQGSHTEARSIDQSFPSPRDVASSSETKRNESTRISDGDVFRKDGIWINTRLRKRVIQQGWMPYKCAVCGNPGTHMNKPLTLHLDHENGDHRDCRKENLRWLCPNCHTQTATYARTTNQPKPKIGKSSQLCLFSESERAVRQYPLKRKVDHGLVKSDYAETGSYKKTGENLGISGRSVKRIVLDLGWKKP